MVARRSEELAERGSEVLMSSGLLPDGDQLELALKGASPWNGRSPRSLTAAYLRFVDKSRKMAEPARADDFFPDPAQFTLFLQGKSDGS